MNPDDMDRDNYFWKVHAGEQPAPPCAQTLGAHIEQVDPEAGEVRMRFEAHAGFTNPAGGIQGGFLAAMLDDTMGPALAATLRAGEFAPTLSLNVAFERAARVGTLVGLGKVSRRGADVCHLQGELWQEGRRIATASAVALIRKEVA